LAFVIVSYNTVDLLVKCIYSIQSYSQGITYEIIVVDNNSSDDTLSTIRQKFPNVLLIAEKTNWGFGVANNIGVAAASAPFVMLLNSDAFLLQDTGTALVNYLKQNPEIGCVGPRVLMPNGLPQPKIFGNLPSLWRLFCQSCGLNLLFKGSQFFSGIDADKTNLASLNVGWISGVCICLRREIYQAINGFDPRFFMYCEDIDFCRRLKNKNLQVVHLNAHEILHMGGASCKSEADRIKNTLFQQRNLLKIMQLDGGRPIEIVARLIIGLGLVVRMMLGCIAILFGVAGNVFLVRSSYHRAIDLYDGLIKSEHE